MLEIGSLLGKRSLIMNNGTIAVVNILFGVSKLIIVSVAYEQKNYFLFT